MLGYKRCFCLLIYLVPYVLYVIDQKSIQTVGIVLIITTDITEITAGTVHSFWEIKVAWEGNIGGTWHDHIYLPLHPPPLLSSVSFVLPTLCFIELQWKSKIS